IILMTCRRHLFGSLALAGTKVQHGERVLSLSDRHSKVFLKFFLFISSARRNESKKHPPSPSLSLYGEDVIDYEGDPLRQSFGIARKAFALRASDDYYQNRPLMVDFTLMKSEN
ncbi:MAG: hypothetical protein J5658_06720, partial [Prevotella sp.]|nr:hypothetical protein [Prevotella sp.]